MSTENESNQSNKKSKISSQEMTERKETVTDQLISLDHCCHVLKLLTVKPNLWPRPEFKEIRECVEIIKACPNKFSSVSGDNLPDLSAYENNDYIVGKQPALSKDYVSSIAQYHEVDVSMSP